MVTFEEVFEELAKRGLSLDGSEDVLRERLLRTLLLERGGALAGLASATGNTAAPTGCGFIPPPPPGNQPPPPPPRYRARPTAPPRVAPATYSPQQVYYGGWIVAPALSHALLNGNGRPVASPHGYIIDPPSASAGAARPSYQQSMGYSRGDGGYDGRGPAGGYRGRLDMMMAAQQHQQHHAMAGMKNDDLLNKPPEEKRPSAYDEEKQQARIIKLRKMAAELEVKRILARATPEAWRLNHEISQIHKWLRQAEKRQAREHAKRRQASAGQLAERLAAHQFAAYAASQVAQQQAMQQQQQQQQQQQAAQAHAQAQAAQAQRFHPYAQPFNQGWTVDDNTRVAPLPGPPFARLSPNTGVVGMPPPSAPQQVKIVNAAPSPYPHPGVVPQQHMGSAPLEVPAAESEEEKQAGETRSTFTLQATPPSPGFKPPIAGDETEQKESLLSSAYPAFSCQPNAVYPPGNGSSNGNSATTSPDNGSSKKAAASYNMAGQEWLGGDAPTQAQLDLASSGGTTATTTSLTDGEDGDELLEEDHTYQEQLDNCCSLLRDYL